MSDIPVIRLARARAQRWLCYYCAKPMFGEGGPYDAFREARVAGQLDVTAEHLVMRADGGSHDPANVVAAHAFCNAMRSRDASPIDHRALVRAKVRAGKWFPGHLRGAIEKASTYAARSRDRGAFRPILRVGLGASSRAGEAAEGLGPSAVLDE